jgi:hypothetical protein
MQSMYVNILIFTVHILRLNSADLLRCIAELFLRYSVIVALIFSLFSEVGVNNPLNDIFPPSTKRQSVLRQPFTFLY